MNRIFRFLGMVSGILFWGIVLSACGSSKTITVDISDNVKAILETGAPKETYVFYTLADSQSLTWEKIKKQGLWICGELPPLLPEKTQTRLREIGDALLGQPITLKDGSFGAGMIEMDVVVPAGATIEDCTHQGIGIMKNNLGLLLLIKRDASFEGQDTLIEVIFK
jgi:hypothetical protein